jgi:hypothetical protein
VASEPRFRPVGAATPLVEATAGAASAVAFGIASALRRARIFHPDGVAFEAVVEMVGGEHGAPLLDVAARHRAIARFSRGVGLPEGWPDILGLALRLVDAHGPGLHQDLLLVTSGERPGLRHALTPARSFDFERWSTVLPYRVGGRRVLFGARAERRGGSPADRLDDLPAALESGDLRFVLEIADVRGPWTELGRLEVGNRLSAADAETLRFNPAHTGGGIEPIGLLQTVRRLAYRGSQATRPDDHR